MAKTEIFSLWQRTSKNGETYFTGSFDGKPIIGFKNKFKDKESHPDFRFYFKENINGKDGRTFDELPTGPDPFNLTEPPPFSDTDCPF